MNFLGIDTSSDVISISFSLKGELVLDFNHYQPKSASIVLVYIDKFLKKFSCKLKDFHALVVGIGPGSFTGLRVSCSITKAFSLSLNVPIIAIGSFYSLATPFKEKYSKIAVISDAKRNLIYATSFLVKGNRLRRERKENLYSLNEFLKEKEDYFFVTTHQFLRQKIKEINPSISFFPKDVKPKAAHLVSLAREYYQQGRFTPPDKLEPLYIYPKECQIKNV